MNIKSLILGSATVALAATGAQAADAIIIAEPEPVEYVRVCDVYGAGYFYIPGTETCLRISGWVRHQAETVNRGWKLSGPNFGNQSGDGNLGLHSAYNKTFAEEVRGIAPGAGHTAPNTPYGHLIDHLGTKKDRGLKQGTGAQINLDARSETEYGTLRGWVQLEGFTYDTKNPSDINILINRAMIQLGGLYMGYADSLFSSSSNIGGSGLGNYGGFTYADTFNYHYEQRHQVGYQFSGGNGFWGAVGIEHDAETNNYTPDVVGKIAYQQAWGGAWFAAAYDESARGVGIRGGVQANFSPLTVRLDGYYQNEADVSYGRDAKWALQAAGIYQINPQFAISAGVEYRKDLTASNVLLAMLDPTITNPADVAAIADVTGKSFIGGHAWAAQVGINWQPVQNFQIGADVTYDKQTVSLGGNKASQDATRFRLRFQRNF